MLRDSCPTFSNRESSVRFPMSGRTEKTSGFLSICRITSTPRSNDIPIHQIFSPFCLKPLTLCAFLKAIVAYYLYLKISIQGNDFKVIHITNIHKRPLTSLDPGSLEIYYIQQFHFMLQYLSKYQPLLVFKGRDTFWVAQPYFGRLWHSPEQKKWEKKLPCRTWIRSM